MQKVRKALRIVIQIGILSLFFIVGATIQEYFNLVIPGSVIGLVLLFLCLFFNVIPERWIKDGAGFMTKHLIIFFIPATVGILNYYNLFIGKGFWLVIITIVSSLIVLVTSGYVSEKLSERRSSRHV